MSLENIKATALELAEIKEQIKDLEARKAQIEGEVRAALAGRGEVSFSAGAGAPFIYTFNCKELPGRITYDTKAMVADGLDIEKYKKVGSPYSTLTVKKVEVG